MLIASFPAGPWQANCYLLATEQGGRCVVVDPGVDAADGVRQGLKQYGLSLDGVLLTHGHVDHVAAAATIADEAGVPVWVHEADVDLLQYPLRALGDDAKPILEALCGGTEFTPPSDVRHYEGDVMVAGIRFGTRHAPGHTPGCTLLLPELGEQQLVFTGDVVFAGSIGRTDLPRGDGHVMASSLVTEVLPLPDEAHLLPGHGPTTTMAAERMTNPWLQPDRLVALQNPDVDGSDL
ncbi:MULTISPECIES: MBL fold metallo-hydrolase [unclassified Luteococcus]|uniref:MBL fold metallo-hydrolase n=1 Tax=unclassified Luteococcus TaxID=2639923 RepID=UPI00313B984B